MDRTWLEAELAAGRSIESIARQVGRHPSTVAYWVEKHDLISTLASKHAARGGIAKDQLEELVALGLTIEQLAGELGMSGTSVRHWLRRYGLRTRRAREISGDVAKRTVVVRECARHGWTDFVLTKSRGTHRCRLCRVEHVSNRRRRVKELLINEAGGACQVCGYARYVGALQFHHLDPGQKVFALSSRGLARSLDSARQEAAKCALLCANCHAEVEAGIATIAA